MEKWKHQAARLISELALLEILTELGAEIQYALRPSDEVAIGFQAFWPDRREPYDARAHANIIP